MRLAELLDQLHTGEHHLEATPDGKLRLHAPAATHAELGPAVRTHRALLAWRARGLRTGHVLGFCTTCDEPSLTPALRSDGKARKTWPACRMTPGCRNGPAPRASS
jgi:hypothetical protein